MSFITDKFFNDTVLVGTYILIAVFSLFLLAVSIFFHELGHWFFFKVKLKKNIKIRFQYKNIWSFKWLAGEQADYNNLTERQYYWITAFGFLFGLIPILVAGTIYTFFLLIAIPYAVGSKKDLIGILKRTNLED